MATLNAQVAAAGDDAFVTHPATFTGGSNTLWLGDNGAPLYGLFGRFTLTGIQQGATINTAYLKPTADAPTAANTVRSNIYADDADDAAAPASYADYAGVTPTTAVVAWDSIAAFVLNTQYTSPDIASVVQEIVSRPGYVAGNHIVILWDNDASDNLAHRRCYAYEQDPTKALVLAIDYTNPAASKFMDTYRRRRT
jgi:hypothetical protein